MEQQISDKIGKAILGLIDRNCPFFARYFWNGEITECAFGTETGMYALLRNVPDKDVIAFGLRPGFGHFAS